ncbi:MAG: hypothetical protein V4628_10245 [Pseudomonadota bacterium]
MKLRFGRIAIAAISAEILGVVALIILVMIFAPAEQDQVQAFAERLGAWVGPISGFLLCVLGGYWVANKSGSPIPNGVAMGVAAAMLDIAVALAIGATFAPLLFLSNAGRVIGGALGGYLASRRNLSYQG